MGPGTRYGCAIHERQVSCWGRNDAGQLGDGTLISRGAPAPVAGVTDPIKVAAAEEGGDQGDGAGTTCAIDGTGAVLCWGRNDFGQVGDNSMTNRQVPIAIGIADAVDLATGYSHNCAVRADGRVMCWGGNDGGEIDATGTNHATPVEVPEITGAVEVAVGNTHTCVRHADSTVSCWGGNAAGQLGDGTTVRRAPGEVRLPGPYSAIAAADLSTCAITEAGGVECWGANAFGQLGDGSTTDRATPTPMVNVDNVLQLAAAHANTCVLMEGGEVACSGFDEDGECGDGVPGGVNPVPARVVVITDFVEVAFGYHTGCGRRGDGAVFCWGTNNDGELGDGTTTSSATPVAVALP